MVAAKALKQPAFAVVAAKAPKQLAVIAKYVMYRDTFYDRAHHMDLKGYVVCAGTKRVPIHELLPGISRRRRIYYQSPFLLGRVYCIPMCIHSGFYHKALLRRIQELAQHHATDAASQQWPRAGLFRVVCSSS